MERRRPNRPAPVATDNLRRHRPDYWLLILCVSLLAIGLVVVYAISPALKSGDHLVVRQLMAIGLSLVAFAMTAKIPLGQWQRWHKPLLIAAGLATALALIMPVNPNYPAHRWVRLGGFSFQSVELLKFAVVVWLAGILAAAVGQGWIKDVKRMARPLGLLLGVVGVIVVFIQSDFGSGVVMLAMMAVMMTVAGVPLRRLFLVGAVIGAALLLAIAVTPYRRERLQAYLNPATSHCSQAATGYQACQAIVAVGSGGLIGLGLGSSVQAYGYLPEAPNDSIFAIYAEKFGFIGSIVLLAIFGALFARLFNIAARAPDNFSRFLVLGIVAWLGTQTLINIGAMIGLFPLKGITLPLISYGGTSMVFVAAAMGLAHQVSGYTVLRLSNERSGGHDNRLDGRRVRGAYHPDFSGRS